MTIYIFTGNNPELFSSLRRYFYYVLGCDLKPIQSVIGLIHDAIILLLNEEKVKENFVSRYYELLLLNNQIILFGFSGEEKLNLMQFSKLKSLLSDIDISPVYPPLFTIDEIKEKLKNFFHSHGEESIFSDLNFIQYAVGNYSLYLYDEIDFENYHAAFLKPAIKRFQSFETKLNKYSDYIILAGYEEEILLLRDSIPNLKNLFVEVNLASEEKNDKSVKKIELIIGSLTEINDILNKIFNKL